MAAIPKRERLLNLVSFLLKARRPAGITEIKERVDGYRDSEASPASIERRFERDKASLRELGIPVEYVEDETGGRAGYMIPRDAYFLPRIALTSDEAALLSAAGRFAMEGAAGPVSDALRSAVRKLQFDSPLSGSVRGTAEESFIFHRSTGEKPSADQGALRALTAAAMTRRTVKFSYYAIGANAVTRRVVEPYGIGYSEGHWYLAGYDRGRKDIRLFRIDRIRGEVRRVHPDVTRAEFNVPEDFRVQDYVGVPPWLFGKSTHTEVRIRFDADVAFMVRMRPDPGDAWEMHDDGFGTLTRAVTNLNALLNWTLRFGRHAEVLEPPEFRERVVAALREMAAEHRRTPPKRKDHD